MGTAAAAGGVRDEECRPRLRAVGRNERGSSAGDLHAAVDPILLKDLQAVEADLSGIEQRLERARHDALARLRILAQEMGGSFSATVNEYFLSTLVGAIVTDEVAVFFHMGDGLIVANGEEIWLEPEAGNEPIYLSYAMVETSLAARPDMLQFQIVRVIATDRLDSFLVGSDGLRDLANAAAKPIPGQTAVVGPLSQFWTDDAFFRNKDKVRRRLALINQTAAVPDWDARVLGQELGHLKDDTTLIVGRRTP